MERAPRNDASNFYKEALDLAYLTACLSTTVWLTRYVVSVTLCPPPPLRRIRSSKPRQATATSIWLDASRTSSASLPMSIVSLSCQPDTFTLLEEQMAKLKKIARDVCRQMKTVKRQQPPTGNALTAFIIKNHISSAIAATYALPVVVEKASEGCSGTRPQRSMVELFEIEPCRDKTTALHGGITCFLFGVSLTIVSFFMTQEHPSEALSTTTGRAYVAAMAELMWFLIMKGVGCFFVDPAKYRQIAVLLLDMRQADKHGEPEEDW